VRVPRALVLYSLVSILYAQLGFPPHRLVTMDNNVSYLGSFPAISPLTGIAALGLLTIVIKRRYFSPLSDIPGPFFASFTRLWQVVTMIRGDSLMVFYDLHQKYGPFVRVAPDEVSVSHPDAPKRLLLTPLAKVPYFHRQLEVAKLSR